MMTLMQWFDTVTPCQAYHPAIAAAVLVACGIIAALSWPDVKEWWRRQSAPKDRYNSILPRLFAPTRSIPWAITLGQTTFYSVSASLVDPGWRRHEDCHKMQWRRDGRLKFVRRYLWQLARKGYNEIDYEIEARAAAAGVEGG